MRAGQRLSPYTPAWDLQQACGTGLQSIVSVGDAIAAGRIEAGIGGGVDTTSDAPIGVNNELREFLLSLNRARSTGDRIKLLGNVRPSMLGIEIPRNGEPPAPDCRWASMLRSPRRNSGSPAPTRTNWPPRATATWPPRTTAGSSTTSSPPFLGLTRDDNLRPDSSVEKLSTLKPVFGTKLGDATMTAGNSTPLTDGASAALLSTEEWAAARSLPVLAYLVDSETAAVDYIHGGDGLLMAPTYAIPRLLKRNGLSLQDFDYYEIHEAFASVVLATLQAFESEEYCKGRLGLDAPARFDRPQQAQRQRVLPRGGGAPPSPRPAAASSRRSPRCCTRRRRRRQARAGGLISICAAGGQGVTAILEA